jgi:hypothetical protein
LPWLRWKSVPELVQLPFAYRLVEFDTSLSVIFPNDTPKQLHLTGREQNILTYIWKSHAMQSATCLRNVGKQSHSGLIQRVEGNRQVQSFTQRVSATSRPIQSPAEVGFIGHERLQPNQPYSTWRKKSPMQTARPPPRVSH